MMTSNRLYIVFFILILISCKKSELENLPKENDPQFLAEGTIDGEPFSIIAGEEGAYMNTFTEEVNGVNVFSGNLSDGTTEIKIGFFDGKINVVPKTLDQADLQSIKWDIDYNTPLATLSKSSFENASQIDHIEWYSGDEFLGTNTVSITEPGKYCVKAIVTFTDASVDSISNIIVLGYNTNENYTIDFDIASNGDFTSWINISNGTVASRIWKLDGQVINTTADNISDNLDDGTHELTATVRFTNGTERTKTIHIDGNNSTNHHLGDYTACELNPMNTSFSPRDFKFLLVLKKNNIEYRSDYVGNSSPAILVNHVTYFGMNASGNKVYKFNAVINTTLKNTSNNQITPLNFKTILGVEIP